MSSEVYNKQVEEAQIFQTLRDFERIESHEIGARRVYLGLEDDGEHQPEIVTLDNLAESRDRFARRWSLKYPDLFPCDTFPKSD